MNSEENYLINPSGPEISVESALDLGNRLQVRPSPTTQHLQQGGVVDASESGDATDAAAVDLLVDVDDEPASDLSVGDRLYLGPGRRRELNGEIPPSARHDASVEERGEVAEFTGLPNPVQPVHSGDSNHHTTDVGSLKREIDMIIDNYKPYKSSATAWAIIADVVRDAVRMTQLTNAGNTINTLRQVRNYMDWATVDCGFEAELATFDDSRIARYAAIRYSTPSPANRRSEQRLRAVAAAVNQTREFTPASNRGAAPVAQPYSATEFAGQDSWARGLRQTWRRRDAQMFIALGRGAGLESSEMSELQKDDVEIDGSTTILHIRGGNARTVPMFHDEAEVLHTLIEQYEINEHLFSLHTRSCTEVGQAFMNQRSPQKPNTLRLRSTWLVRHLTTPIPLKEFLAAAGLKSTHSLTRYMSFVDSNPDAARILTGKQAGL